MATRKASRSTGKRKNPGKSASVVRKLAADRPAARDEGPRLIPLDDVQTTPSARHYLELADIALAPAKPAARKNLKSRG